ncbi:hypothetical protein HPB52_002671 [Rhipicephalus sanguineus]|uniref:RING-type domain-containing protein n=1 Tax=Rhipicephalus sanguineus TaxID=34632 RepID=A0A9D4SMX1_RHISA|nr:hypothetical protein HPB52_002671 [Rhipicephalus sanguineus]
MVIVTSADSFSAADDDVQGSEANPTVRTDAVDEDVQDLSETPAVITQSNDDAASEDASPYILIGFESPMRGLFVQFAQPLSGIAVCSGCRALPEEAMLLPCDHVLCLACRDNCSVETTVWCPKEWAPRSAFHLWPIRLNLEQVRGDFAFCVNSWSGCPFKAELRDVEQHYATCHY